MAAWNKFNSFVAALGNKVHNLETDDLKVVLTNSAPTAANTVLTDVTQIANGNGYTTGGTSSANNVFTQSGGVAKLTSDDVVFTSSGAGMAAFRYAVLYNNTATNDELIGWVDYGSALTLLVGETLTVDFDGTNGIFTVT